MPLDESLRVEVNWAARSVTSSDVTHVNMRDARCRDAQTQPITRATVRCRQSETSEGAKKLLMDDKEDVYFHNTADDKISRSWKLSSIFY
jgi:hypothetical protein